MTTAARRRLLLGAAATALVLWFVAAEAVRVVEPLALDQGLFACFTRWVPRGWLPYRDLFDSKPPLFLYTYALARLFPTDLVRGIWALEALWLMATLALAYALGARVGGRAAGVGAAALLFCGLWAPGWGGYWSRAQADELLALPMLGAARLAWAAHDRPALAWWAGVLTGVAGLYKIPSMAIAAAWPLGWLVAGSWRASLGRTGRMALGLVAPWALAVAWFAAHGAFGAFVEGVLVYGRHNAAYIAPPWGEVLAEFARQMIVHAPLLLLLAAVGVGALRRRRAREAAWLLPWILLTMAAVIVQRQLAGYQFLDAMPALAVAGGFGLVALAEGLVAAGARRLFAALASVVALALAVDAGARWWRAYGDDARCLAGRISREEFLARLQPGGFSPGTEEAAARYLDAHSAPGDGVFVWGLGPGIYALADRHPVTRFPFHKILYTDAPLSRLIPGLAERRAELLRRLAADPPVYILVGRHDRNGFEPEESFRSMMRFDELRELIRRDYAEETKIGDFVLFRRR